MKTLGIVQARMSSTRLPGKVMLPLDGKPIIIFMLERLKCSRRLDEIVVATSVDNSDDILADTVISSGFKVFRGPLDDVLKRFSICTRQFDADYVVRLTGDCPLIDAELVDEMIDAFKGSGCDYLCNTLDDKNLSIPDGLDVEIFTSAVLDRAASEAKKKSEREHVTSWFMTQPNTVVAKHYVHRITHSYFRVTIDDYLDYQVVSNIVNALVAEKGSIDSWGVEEVVRYLEGHPETAAINAKTERNAGYFKSLEKDSPLTIEIYNDAQESTETGQRLWKRAKQVIPGGNMLLSKRPEMFLPEHWPAYYASAKGCNVTDLDGTEYIDMSIMGVGTNILGYNQAEVNSAAISALENSNMCTLNSPDEVYLAEKLIELHPWAEMVRFARSGGEANAIAIRIARAATGRETVAICGYHGWHDWYLATNLKDRSGLSEHLLPGLNPNGVPSALAGTARPFSYNNFQELLEIVNSCELAAIKMEVQRSQPPLPGFLEAIRKICDEKGIVLIFDECTSGFREAYGGLHLKYGVMPDMAMFGKTLGNGFAISATIGKRSVMEAAQDTFISSTFWTERIGPSAALKTLAVMKREQSWMYTTNIGNYMKQGWSSLAKRNNLEILHEGLPALTGFSFKSASALKYKTYITQEMLKKGYLAGTSFYASTAHTTEIVDRYLDDLDRVFAMIHRCESEEASIDDMLEGPVCHSTFARLT